MDLASLGWNDRLRDAFEQIEEKELVPARVMLEHRKGYSVWSELGELEAEVPGKMRHDAKLSSELPAVGDWIAVRVLPGERRGQVVAVLPRSSKFSRKVAGEQVDEQVVAANVDIAFLVSGLDQEPNLRKIERYLTVAWESGAQPVVVLAKSDLADDAAQALEDVVAIAPGVPVHAVSNLTGEGFEELQDYFEPGKTFAVMGSSGVGKSSFINRLVGEEVMTTQEIRWDGKGRHTTTHRELIVLPQGGSIIDTPGMRELQLWDASEGLESAFSDVLELAEGCRFRDCIHESEPGCAVKLALEEGRLAPERFQSYRKQLREIAAIARKRDKQLANIEAKKWKKLTRDARARARLR
jgi:ribosome biogenesis GTPase